MDRFSVCYMVNGFVEINVGKAFNQIDAENKALEMAIQKDLGVYEASDYNGDFTVSHVDIINDNHYLVTVEVDGFRLIEIEAKNYDEAFKRASELHCNNFGEISIIDKEEIVDICRL